MYELCLRSRNHERRYTVSTHAEGWEARVEHDREVRQVHQYHDWHRVERALSEFEREIAELVGAGWQLAAVSR
jgi:hypothetical protein